MPKLAASLSIMFTELDFLDRFKAAADVGFKGVECTFPYPYPAVEVKQRLDDYRLAMVKFNMSPGNVEAGDFGLAALPGRQSEFREGVDKAIQYARALGCTQLHAMAGVAPEGESRKRCMEIYLENLRFAADTCAAHGIRVLIEAINTRDFPGYFLNRPTHARKVIDIVGSDNLFLNYDIYHAQIMEGDLAKTIRANIDTISYFQIAGVPGRHEPDEGEINYGFLFDVIDSLGYDDWIGCEYNPRAGTIAGLDWARPYAIG